MSLATSPRRKKSRSGVRRPESTSLFLLTGTEGPEEDCRDDEHDRAEDHQRARREPPYTGTMLVDDHVRGAHRHRGVLELRREVAAGLFGIGADLHRIRPDERAGEDAPGQPGDVVALERL